MISVTSGEESPFVTGGATPPPLPSRKTEVLPDPQALIRDRRSAANAANPDTPALPPKVRLLTSFLTCCRVTLHSNSDRDKLSIMDFELLLYCSINQILSRKFLSETIKFDTQQSDDEAREPEVHQQ